MRYRVPLKIKDVLIKLSNETGRTPSDILHDYLVNDFQIGNIENFTKMAESNRATGTWPEYKAPELAY